MEEGFSVVASGVGRPLYQDAITKSYTNIDFARVYVMVDFDATLPQHVMVVPPLTEGGMGSPCKVDVEYEWFPSKFIVCHTFGHKAEECPMRRRAT